MSPSRTRQRGTRRSRTVPLLAVTVSLALHGLAIASIVGWPDGQAPDAPPQVIAVGMVFAEQQTGDPSDAAVMYEVRPSTPTDQYSSETVELTHAAVEPPPIPEPESPRQEPATEPVALERPSPPRQPAPSFVEATRIALSDPSPEEADNEPPEPFVFFDEGTRLVDRSPDIAPGLPARRPATPIAFQPAEPPVAEPPTPEPAAQNPPAAASDRPADQPSDAPLSTLSVMAMQPVRFTGPGLANPGPEYPRSARRRGDEGTVVLRVLVSAAGLPQHIEIRSSSGVQALDQAAIEAVEGWQFIAARRGDVAVSATIDVPIAFRLTAD